MGAKFEIADLVAQYTLNPELCDVFVEGAEDVHFVKWLLQGVRTSTPINVLEIQTVNIPADIVDRHGMPLDNHGRLVALAQELQLRLPPSAKATCFADVEYDHLLDRVCDIPTLVYTDGTSIECFALSEARVQHFIDGACRKLPCSTRELLSNITNVLTERYIIKAANLHLGWGLSWIDSLGTLDVDSRSAALTFDRDAFVRTYLQRGARQHDIAEFESTCDRLRERARQSPLRSIGGHDFPIVLTHVIRRHLRARGLSDAEAVRTTLLQGLQRVETIRGAAGQRLLQRLGD